MYATDGIEFSGETDVYTYSGGSGMNIHAHFCKTCNANVNYLLEAMDGITSVLLGEFDNAHKISSKIGGLDQYKT